MHILNGILHSSNRMLNRYLLKRDFNPLNGMQKSIYFTYCAGIMCTVNVC